jgi:hypothetical protein
VSTAAPDDRPRRDRRQGAWRGPTRAQVVITVQDEGGTEVARRAGHGVAVLLNIYAHCIDGLADAANQRITDALGTTESEPGSGDEGDADSEPAA